MNLTLHAEIVDIEGQDSAVNPDSFTDEVYAKGQGLMPVMRINESQMELLRRVRLQVLSGGSYQSKQLQSDSNDLSRYAVDIDSRFGPTTTEYVQADEFYPIDLGTAGEELAMPVSFTIGDMISNDIELRFVLYNDEGTNKENESIEHMPSDPRSGLDEPL